MESAFPQLFGRHGRKKDHVIKLEDKKYVKFIQQKSKRLPIQLEKAVQNKIAQLMNEKHIQKVSTLNNKVFTQPTLITEEKRIKVYELH